MGAAYRRTVARGGPQPVTRKEVMMPKTLDETRCFSIYDPVLGGHDIVCRTGMHSTVKVATVRVQHGVEICSVEELAALICDYLDGKLMRKRSKEA